MHLCAPDLPAWNPQSVSRKARRASRRGTSLKPFLGSPLQQGPGHRLPPTDTAAFLMVLLRPSPGEGTSDPSWCGTGLSPPWGASHCGNHEIAWLSATSHSVPSFIGVPYPWLPPPPVLISIQSSWTGATERGLGSFAVEGSAEVGCGGVFGGGAGGAYGSVSILDDSAVLSRSQTETTSTHTRWRPWKVENYKQNGLGSFHFLLFFFFFFLLFAHKFHLLQHRILVATKGNASLPLMKKLINIHLPSSMIHHELYMNTCLGGQTVSLCVQSI